MRTCHKCGAQNRITAAFCKTCGETLPLVNITPPPPPPNPPAKPSIVGQPLPPIIAPPTSLAKPQPVQKSAAYRGRHNHIEGQVITDVNITQNVRLPFDPGYFLVLVTVALFLAATCIMLALFAFVLVIVLAVIGMGISCLPILLGGTSLVSILMANILGKQDWSVMNFQVHDDLAGIPVSIMLFFRNPPPLASLGDRVEVYGQFKPRDGIMRAHKIIVTETSHQPAHFELRGARPWPLWPGIILLISAVSVIAYILMESGALYSF
jgi:hypothetical protein